jgi:geranylgeranyl pyrophosphate synthase
VEFNEVVESLRGDLDQVEARLHQAANVDYPLVGDFLEGIITSGGKRLRPTLLLLAARPFEYDLSTLIPAAAGIELLHTASLVHDDTIDHALLRRGQPTLNTAFPTETVILLGDYLFAQSAMLATETMNARVVAVFAAALGEICDGQLREIFNGSRLDQTREDYELRIYGKTASLFAAAAEMGAILGNASEDEVANLRAFGSDIGMAFQIVDDVLDFRSTAEQTGKPVGADLRQGTVTLPTMLFLASLDGSPTATQVRRIVDGEPVPEEEVAAVATLIAESTATDAALESAHTYARRALARLESLDNRHIAAQLAALADLSVNRLS